MATDQEIRDAGFKYVPQQKYLLNPFQLPEDQEPVVDQGIVATNAFAGSGGDNFSVYNPDPNSIVNRTYQPNYEYRQFVDGYDPNLSATMNMKMMEVDPNYKGADYYNKPSSKMEGLLSMIPYAGGIMKGVKFLGDQISPYLPVNRRAILENELGGQGIMVNDIGQIVQGQGDYDTAANVMAGYNANKLTAESFDKRIAMAKEKMSDKNKGARIAALEAAKADFLNAQGKTDKIFDFEEEEKKKKKKDTIISRFITKKKEDKAVADAANANETSVGNYPTGGSYDAPGGVTSSNYDQAANISGGGGGNTARNSQGQTAREATYDGNPNTGTSQGYSQHYARGGRAGYFYGGRVNYKVGGRTDAESQYGADSVGSYDSSQNKSNRPQSYGGDDNNNQVINRPVDISTVTKSLGDYNIPYGVEALISDKGRLQAVLNADNILDKNLGLDFTYDQGPYQVGFNADMEGNKNLGLSYNKGNLSAYANTDFNNPSVGFKYSKAFAYGGLASIL